MLGRLALAAVVVATPACGEAARVDEVRVTAPADLVELVPVPGDELTLAWTVRGAGPLTVAATLVPDRVGGPSIAVGRWDADVGGAIWRVPDPPPQHGTYRIRVEVAADGAILATAEAQAIVVMQGAHFRDSALTFSAADAERDLWIEATVGRPVTVELRADAGADARRLFRGTIASDLAPVGRVLRWPAVDLDGAALPAATYAVWLDLTAADGERYRVDGLTVTWTP